MRTSGDVVRQLEKRGWAPALWAHHPPEVRRAIRGLGWRPQVKQCFMNCQRFLLSGALDVEYREGWIVTVIPMEHAWLTWRGSVLDLTLEPGRDVTYLESHPASYAEVASNVVRTRSYGPVFPERLAGTSPFRRMQAELLARTAGARAP